MFVALFVNELNLSGNYCYQWALERSFLRFRYTAAEVYSLLEEDGFFEEENEGETPRYQIRLQPPDEKPGAITDQDSDTSNENPEEAKAEIRKLFKLVNRWTYHLKDE